MKRFGRPRNFRLRKEDDFDRVYSGKQRAGDEHLLLFAQQNGTQTTRVGLSVSKRHGNAVVRARIKRLLREAHRLLQHDLPQGVDLILIPRQNSGATLNDYKCSLKTLVHRVLSRQHRKKSGQRKPSNQHSDGKPMQNHSSSAREQS